MLLLACMMACRKSMVERDAQLLAAIQELDQLWEERAAKGLDPSIAAAASALERYPERAGILWRSSRVAMAQGLVDPDEALRIRHFARARELGWSCLRNDPRFTANYEANGLEAALNALDDRVANCAVWTAVGWSRWLVAFGPEAAALDLKPLSTLTAATRQMQPEGAGAWAYALVTGFRVDAEANPRDAEQILTVLADQVPDPTGGVAALDKAMLLKLPAPERPPGALTPEAVAVRNRMTQQQ